MTPLLATNLATVSQLAEYQILCGKPRFNSKAQISNLKSQISNLYFNTVKIIRFFVTYEV